MINFDSLVISVPSHQAGEPVFLGSVFDAKELLKLKLPADLQLAVELILGKTARLQCVVRPEMFTHGTSLEWLMQKIGVTDHLCLSDGAAVKLIPGMRNHLFAYGLQSSHRVSDFKKLMRRAPELLQQFDTQINSFHNQVARGAAPEPKPLGVMLKAPLPAKLTWFYAFYLNPHSVEESVNYMVSWGGLDERKLAEFERITYIPLTHIASSDVAFQREVCESIATTYFNPASCLVIRLPLPGMDLPVRIKTALEGMGSSGARLPRARASNVFFVSDDVSEQTLTPLSTRLSWLMHSSVEYWRYTQSLYRNSDQILIFPGRWPPRSCELAKKLLTEVFGKAPDFVAPDLWAENPSLLEFLR